MPGPVRILVTGDREWTSGSIIHHAFDHLPQESTIIEGKALGADVLAYIQARLRDFKTERYPAWWKCEDYEEDQGKPCKLEDGRHEAFHGRAAGVFRNQRMLEQSNPTEVWAFHDDLDNSKGTKDMVQRALRAGLKVMLFSHEHPEGIVLQTQS